MPGAAGRRASGLVRQRGRSAARQVPARDATTSELTRVHTPQYLGLLRNGIGSGYGNLDADTYFSPGTRDATWLAAGGAIDLATTLTSGGAKRGVALLRPPGHHATPGTSMGFCLLNNIALAASNALASGMKRVAIVDWDVHHGNGTQDAFYADPRVLFISSHQFRCIRAPAQRARSAMAPGAVSARTWRCRRAAVTKHTARRSAKWCCRCCAHMHRSWYSCLRGSTPTRATRSRRSSCRPPVTARWRARCSSWWMRSATGRIGFVLEGGYDLQALEASVAQVGASLHRPAHRARARHAARAGARCDRRHASCTLAVLETRRRRNLGASPWAKPFRSSSKDTSGRFG